MQTITVHVGYGAVLLEFCGGQRNSFPDELKFPSDPESTRSDRVADTKRLHSSGVTRTWAGVQAGSALGALADASGEFFDVIEHLASLGHLGQDFALGVHDGGVVTTEGLPDLGK